MSPIQSHEELEVYRLAFEGAMRILWLRSVQVFEVTKGFPREEVYSLTDQMRRSSRSVCSNIAEAWRKRRYEAAFVSKLNDAESEAVVPRRRSGCFAKTQTWLRFAVECNYLPGDVSQPLHQTYDHIIGKLVTMIVNPTPWLLPKRSTR